MADHIGDVRDEVVHEEVDSEVSEATEDRGEKSESAGQGSVCRRNRGGWSTCSMRG